ncbi:carboxypeptidase regulatory-like domain-containing protein [Brevundimonas sp. Root1423]|uniref:TonB-dependent receptor n=1 Tax=Brevundimonas sp. Root1423 TaxID=1736462 RepID=UPI0007018844|nr:carboxypeptidase regulatory-like domain-containing protein [Brevundimonas sp. Root1423]KQY91739.1 TonB-dependent receptor [Brevundimonas sp. Root1423]
MNRKSIHYMGAASALALAVSLACAGGVSAQVTTATIRGSVTDDGVAEAGAAIVARDTSSGFTTRSTANANGGYVLSGLRPGTYEVTVTTADGETASDVVTIGVGQVGDLDLAVGAPVAVATDPNATDLGDVVVTGRRLAEVRTPENATNVTTQQINGLPQINRNFLNFAALAPGVRLSLNEEEQTITAGGQRAESINAFIDGASLKSNVIGGGIIGQDDSRGNPFPQAGIQEFRVVSQNFKAEYEQASSAIITAVTRSGTNEFHGEIFGVYRDQNMVSQDYYAKQNNQPKVDLEVQQYGFALGGPIIRDTLHFFGTYEHKQENRARTVSLDLQDPRFVAQFGPELGTFAAPFEEDLFFGKLSWQPADGHLVDWSVTYRDESDLRDFGNGPTSVDRANNLQQTTLTSNLRYQWRTDSFLNEFAVDYRDYNYNPGAANFTDLGENYRVFTDTNPAPGFQPDYFGGITVFNAGGRDSTQDIHDNALTFRDDLTFNDVEFNGFHTIKLGAKVSLQNYQVNKQFGRNPLFYYDVDGRPELSGSTTVPYRVELGRSFPEVDLDNTVIGLYAQDDWQITDQLELNLGIRWDYETNANNNDYVTPASVVAGLDQWIASTDGGKPAGYAPSWFNRADYISTGNNRDPFAGAFQPRIGFSYDVFGDRATVIFGGAGRYYDRVNFNFSYDEIVKPFDIRQNAFFTTNPARGRPAGQDRDPGPGTDFPGESDDPVLWQESYRTAAGLDPVFANIPGKGEAFLLANDFEPPMTDQFNLGLRQRFGDWQSEFTLAYGKTENEFTWAYVTRCREPTRGNDGGGFGDNGGFCGPGGTNPYRGYFASDHNKEREFRALYVKLDKNYTPDSGWGLNVAYTWSEAEQNGGRDAFCFDCFSIESSPVRPADNDERHRIVANGIVDLPWDFQLSGILTLGSGVPFDVFDGRGPNFVYRPNHGRPQQFNFIIPNSFAYRNLDLRLTKDFEFGGSELSLYLDAINVFNFDNFTGFDGGTGSATNPNPNFERPSRVLFPTRTFQVGMRYSF